MAPVNDKRIHQLWPSWAILVGCVLLYIGERVFDTNETMRMALGISGVVAVLAAVVVRVNEMLSASPDKKPVAQRILFATLGVAAALALYGMIAFVFDGDDDAAKRTRGTLWGLWPTLLVVSASPLIALEVAVSSVAFNPRYELTRVRNAFSRGLSLGLFLGALVFANYIANEKNEKYELSAENTTRASTQTQQAVRDLTKEVRVVLFYARANEVAETLDRYFEPLAASNPNLKIERVDHALAGELAKETGVTENGYVALVGDGSKDKIRVGTKARSARSALRRFDENFLKALVKVTTQKRIAYIVTGHGERATKTADKEDKRATMKSLKRQLEAWQFTVKTLGVADGLGAEMPKDDGIIFIFGPDKELLESEAQTLVKGTAKGARIFITLDGDAQSAKLDALLNPLGVKFDNTRLANERVYARLTRTDADVENLVSNKYSSHASVTTMTRNARELPTLLSTVGSLSQVEEGKLERVKTDLVLKAMDDTFQDSNGNRKLDEGEKKDRFGIAAAITRTSTTGKKDDEARIFVLADSDVVADDLLKVAQGNIYLFRDAVAWLQRSVDPVVPTVTEKDVKIVHKKEDDSLLFLGTTFLVPAAVMLLGYFGTRRRRRS